MWLGESDGRQQGVKNFNCSTFASNGLEGILGPKLGVEKVAGPFKSVTPNQLWNDVIKNAQIQELKFEILVDPGTKVNNSFRDGIYPEEEDTTEETAPEQPAIEQPTTPQEQAPVQGE